MSAPAPPPSRPGTVLRTLVDRRGRLLISAATAWLCCTASLDRLALGGQPPITAVAFAPDGNSVVAASQRGLLVLDWPGLTPRASLDSTAPNPHALAFSPSGDRLAVGGGSPALEGIIEIRSWPGGERLIACSEQDDSILDLAWVDDRTIASASLDHSIVLLDVESGAATSRLEGHSRGVSALALLPDEGMLVSVGLDQSLRVWDLDAEELIDSLDQHTQPIHAVRPLPGGDGPPLVATASDDRTVRFWQPTIGRMVRFCRLESPALSLDWLPDGSRAVVGCVDGRVRLIDPKTVEVTSNLPAIDGWAYAIAVHPSRDELVVGGPEGQLRRIELGTRGSEDGQRRTE